jgi:pre-rRNA-processing protein TSR3
MASVVKLSIRLIIYYKAQDDPKKCSAKKMGKLGLAKLEKDFHKLPKRLLLLDPFAEKILSPLDQEITQKRGIMALDCSWKTAKEEFYRVRKYHYPRKLPFLLASNEINYGKPFKLTTAEAFMASLWIIGELKQAKAIAKHFKWGETFLALNHRWLEGYRKGENR